jgi:hypothetical protein
VKGSELSTLEVGSAMCETRENSCASPVSDLQVGDTSGGEDGAPTVDYLGESSSCHPANEDDSEASHSIGVGETEVVKDSPLMQKMSHALEVSSVVGVSCDG